MKKLNIAICDDNKEICSQLERFLIDILTEKGVENRIDVFFAGETLCTEMQRTKYDLVFLDIELPHMNGVDVGRHIRETLKNEKIQIAYISAKEGYAMELFDYRPINFLVKPLDREKAERVINKYISVFMQDNNIFTYKKGTEYITEELSDIMYFENIKRKVSIVTIESKAEFYGTLESIYSEVKGKRFLFIHKSVIVNCDYIRVLKYEEVEMADGRVFGISQSRRKIIREQYMRMEEG